MTLKKTEYISNLDKKQTLRHSPIIIPTICCWSDLLGFGQVFSSNNWELKTPDWDSTIQRLVRSQDLCLQHLVPGIETCLSLNDGIVRSFLVENHVDHIQTLALWIRSCILYHKHLNEVEQSEGLPGLRTVMTAGHRAIHNFGNATFDDYIYNYSKPDPNRISDCCKQHNPIVFYNPAAFQMNTAFSKCFLIDEAGSKAGVSGPEFYLENSVLDFIVEFSNFYSDICSPPIFEENNGMQLFAIPKKLQSDYFHLGFDLTGPVKFQNNNKSLNTILWKVKAFYCWDEDPKEFKIQFEEKTGYCHKSNTNQITVVSLTDILKQPRQFNVEEIPYSDLKNK